MSAPLVITGEELDLLERTVQQLRAAQRKPSRADVGALADLLNASPWANAHTSTEIAEWLLRHGVRLPEACQ